ncbi:MAG TPA: carboxypeptidase regulatory-like domain-containing protein [Vicinamibacterales bacterium]|nr:carboxypeptidase regulatory-like domain-containing protein [Vicinamibacterales bacterium]
MAPGTYQALFVFAAFSVCQAAGIQTGSGRLSGRVVDNRGAPLAGAVVNAGCVGASNAFRDRVRTDAQGRFEFANVPVGVHTLCVSHGDVQSSPSRVRIDSAGAATQITIRLAGATGTISGIVTDAQGEAIVGARVVAVSSRNQAGTQTWRQTATARTDDKGFYAIGNLQEGDYVVVVVPEYIALPSEVLKTSHPKDLPPGLFDDLLAAGVLARSEIPETRLLPFGASTFLSARLSALPIVIKDGLISAFPMTAFPVARSIDAGAIQTVAAGDVKTNNDFRLQPIRAHSVAGKVVASGSGAGIPVRLMPAGFAAVGPDLLSLGTYTDKDGAFEFPLVPSGDYLLTAVRLPGGGRSAGPSTAGPVLAAESAITVSDAMERQVLTLKAAARISGRVEFSGAAPAPSPEQLSRISVTATRVDGRPLWGGTTLGSSARVAADGTFTTNGLTAGAYRITVVPPANWSFVEARLDARDVSDVILQVGDEDLVGLVVRFSDAPTTVIGIVRDSKAAPQTDVTIGIFPQGWERGPVSPRRLRTARSDADGRFIFRDLPPGEYLIVGLGEVPSPAWSTPAALKALAGRATRVSVRQGAQQSVDVTFGSNR